MEKKWRRSGEEVEKKARDGGDGERRGEKGREEERRGVSRVLVNEYETIDTKTSTHSTHSTAGI